MRIGLLLLSLGFVLVLAFAFVHYQRSTSEGDQAQVTTEEPKATNPATSALSFESENSKPIAKNPPAVPVQPLVRSRSEIHPPSVEKAREQVKADPELPPPALMDFAQDLGSKMEVALHSEEAAKNLFPDLENCVLDSENKTLTSASVLCLYDAKRLSHEFSSLSPRYESLEANASDKVRDLFETFEIGVRK